MDRPPSNPNGKAGTLHPRNPHAGRYDFTALCLACPDLTRHLRPNPAGDQTIDFADGAAVLCLNEALLAHYYQVKPWRIPAGYLCPPIPGRADAIHHLADLLAGDHDDVIPTGRGVNVLDIGTGANCIYPIIGSRSYGWRFVGTDIDLVAIKSARAIIAANLGLTQLVKISHQPDPASIFNGIIHPGDRYDLTMCNPPFHASMEDAQAGTRRKVKNLSSASSGDAATALNFGGKNAELWCPGGELRFLTRMIRESMEFTSQVTWFTSLVSKSDNLPPLKKALAAACVRRMRVISMSQGQKRSRLIAWSYQA